MLWLALASIGLKLADRKCIHTGRHEANGFGETSPTANNKFGEGKALNRKCEITLLNKLNPEWAKMENHSNSWESDYKQGKLGGHIEPNATLVKYASLVPKEKVLDIGAGEGQNALFFAEKGYKVHVIDLSATAIEKCMTKAKQAKLHLTAEVCDIRDFDIVPNTYGLILASLVLHTFKIHESMAIISRLKQGLVKNGLLYISVLSIEDPKYEKRKAESNEIEKNTFYIQERNHYVHYFQKKELLDQFTGWKLIYFSQAQYYDTEHRKTEPHYHGVITYFGQKVK